MRSQNLKPSTRSVRGRSSQLKGQREMRTCSSIPPMNGDEKLGQLTLRAYARVVDRLCHDNQDGGAYTYRRVINSSAGLDGT
jgi:hypothetical protein